MTDLTQTILKALTTEQLLAELKRRGIEPVLVPSLEKAPTSFVISTLLDRLEADGTEYDNDRGVRRLAKCLVKDYAQLVVQGIRDDHNEVLNCFNDAELWDAISDTDIAFDNLDDEDIWERLSEAFREEKTNGLDGKRYELLSRLSEARDALADIRDVLEGTEG